MKKLIRNLLALAFIGYMVLLIYFLFFSEEYGRTTHYTDYQYNLVLFREITRYIRHRDILGFDFVMINLVGNVVVFMPFGFFVPSLEKRRRGYFLDFLKITLLGFLFSLAVETVQLVTKVGCFDVDDLFLNTIGVVLGYLCYGICRCVWNFARRKNSAS